MNATAATSRRSRRAVLIAVFTAALLAWSPGVSYAHEVWVNHGSDEAVVSWNHHGLIAFDGECDGNNVRAVGYYLGSGEIPYFTEVTDSNGCQSGGSIVSAPYEFVSFRVCEVNVGCSAWKSVT